MPLEFLPDAALRTVVDALACRDRGALRASCRRARAAVNERTQQLRIHVTASEAVTLLGWVARRFPKLTTLRLSGYHDANPSVTEALMQLPTGCWPAVTKVDRSWDLPSDAAAQLPRLCPNLRELWFFPATDVQLGECLRALAAARGLEALELQLGAALCSTGDAAAAAGALARLAGLRRLDVNFGALRADDSRLLWARLLPAALPSLTALTSLIVAAEGSAGLHPALGACPTSLLELTLGDRTRGWGAAALEAAEPMAGVTRLVLLGSSNDDDIATVAAKCPALRELHFTGGCSREATYRFPHLTRLVLQRFLAFEHSSDDDAEASDDEGGDWATARPPRWHLPTIAPQLQSLTCRGSSVGLARALAGHTALRELDLDTTAGSGDGWDPPDARRWHRVFGTLPQLSSLAFKFTPSSFTYQGWDDCKSAEAEHYGNVTKALGRCPRLTRVDLFADGFNEATVIDLLQSVGHAAGSQLVSLTLAGGEPTSDIGGGRRGRGGRGGQGGMLTDLPQMYPRLEALGLTITPQEMPDDLLGFIDAVAEAMQAWPSLRAISLRLELQSVRYAGANTVELLRARCAEVRAACPGKKLAFWLRDEL